MRDAQVNVTHQTESYNKLAIKSTEERQPTAKTTPMMAQYLKIKAQYPDSLLFYRMGDFYELFFEDAKEAAEALKITLTRRGKHLDEDIPMCGVPVHSCDNYLQRLISLGYRVALCEQVENPKETKKRGAKAVVERRVVRLITPATLTESQLLDPHDANHLLALGYDEKTKSHALAWIDISTGVFGVSSTKFEHLLTDIMRFDPKEILVSEKLFAKADYNHLLKTLGRLIVKEPHGYFEADSAENRIKAFYKVASLESFAPFNRAELSAISSAIAYINKTQIDNRPALMRPIRSCEESLFIDNATRNNLELLSSLSGKYEGSLLKAINRTITGAGARLLRERITNPLMTPHKINHRLDAVDYFYNNQKLTKDLRLLLRGLPDMTRALSRLALSRGSPQDLKQIQKSLERISEIRTLFDKELLPQELNNALDILRKAPLALMHHLERAIINEPPNYKREGGFIKKNYHHELDEMRLLRDQSQAVIANMQQSYSLETGIKNLKIKYNNILGYFIEVSAAQADKLFTDPPLKAKFIHRQTMANATRFSTQELSEIESKISHASERVLEIEFEIFETLLREVISYHEFIRQASEALAILDVSSSFAILAEEQNYCRPLVDDSLTFIIEKGRHPVVEQALRRKSEKPFVANYCNLSPKNSNLTSSQTKKGALWLLTGPNMGGKSTFLRQNALIALMAQMGSFVPAEKAHIGIIDRLFSRVGASDDLAQGRSTFMVEMIETATILNQASSRSLVILDEIGRGTATFDGMAIAFSCIEHLHEVNACRTIFATHFHELTQLEKSLERVQNVTMEVKEWDHDVIFLHRVGKGAANRSYGIQVAKLAGLPQKAIWRAQKILEKLENDAPRQRKIVELTQSAQEISFPEAEFKQSALYQALQKLNPDELTPKEALETVYALKTALKEWEETQK